MCIRDRPEGAGEVLEETLAVLKPLCQHLAFFGAYPLDQVNEGAG